MNEKVLEGVVLEAINRLLGDKSFYQTQLQQNIAQVIRDANKSTAEKIDEQLMTLQKELLQKANNKEAYGEIAEQIFTLRETAPAKHRRYRRQRCTDKADQCPAGFH
ncbi:MAG TPA: hypothetical protein OIM34_01965 [Ruminococcus bromii]|nr:hypothetical protein [Ruminococcus bromii]